VTTIEGGERRKPGRPRKFGQGRINATIRFTAGRYAELKVAADATGRSVSEQVEFVIEDYKRIEKVRDEYERKAAEIEVAVDRLAARLDELITPFVATSHRIIDRIEKERSDNERIAEIVATAVAKTFAGRSQQ
jgi:hypothetical protein